MVFTDTTKTEAVNIMLQTIGESTVANLTQPLPFEVHAAAITLDEVLRAVQTEGYTFNTIIGDTLQPTCANNALAIYDITAPAGAVGVLFSIQAHKLWNMNTNAQAAADATTYALPDYMQTGS